MALRILYVGHRNTLFSLEAAAFTFDSNPAGRTMTNATLNAQTPKGVLGGTVAALKGTLLVGAADAQNATVPMGLFINNAAGNPFENTPAVASEKGPFVCNLGVAYVDVYETKDTDGNDLTYAAGNPLYSSAYGLLTKQRTGTQAQVGYVIKPPVAGSDSWLGLMLTI